MCWAYKHIVHAMTSRFGWQTKPNKVRKRVWKRTVEKVKLGRKKNDVQKWKMFWKSFQANLIQRNIKMIMFVLISLWQQRALASCDKSNYNRYKSIDPIGWLCETKSGQIYYDEVLGQRTKPNCFLQFWSKWSSLVQIWYKFVTKCIKITHVCINFFLL